MQYLRGRASQRRDSYPLVPDGPTTLEWLARESIALRTRIEEQQATIQEQDEQLRTHAVGCEEAKQVLENLCTMIARELATPAFHPVSPADAPAEHVPAGSNHNVSEILFRLHGEISRVSELLSTLVKVSPKVETR